MGKTRAQAPSGVTLDAGALIALDRGDKRMIALLQEVIAQRAVLRVPAGALGQAWRDGSKQAVLARLLRSTNVHVVALDGSHARACGELCAATKTADVVDASVVLTAREHGDPIVTSDLADLLKLDPSATLVRI